MKTRIFYFFAIAICAVLAVILLLVFHKGDQTRALRKFGVMPARYQATTSPSITPFQYITDKLDKMGITADGIDVDLANGTVKWSPNSKWGEYFGKPSAQSQPIAPIILQQRQAVKATPQDIRGCYQTKWGLLRLYMKDDVVLGTLNYFGPVHIIGKLKDNILVGIWVSPAHKKRPMLVGPIQLAFANKWSVFRGVWKYKKAPIFNNRWVGTKIPCPAKGTKLTQELVPGGPGVPAKPKPGQGKPGQLQPGQPKPGQGKPGGPAGKQMPQRRPPPANQ